MKNVVYNLNFVGLFFFFFFLYNVKVKQPWQELCSVSKTCGVGAGRGSVLLFWRVAIWSLLHRRLGSIPGIIAWIDQVLGPDAIGFGLVWCGLALAILALALVCLLISMSPVTAFPRPSDSSPANRENYTWEALLSRQAVHMHHNWAACSASSCAWHWARLTLLFFFFFFSFFWTFLLEKHPILYNLQICTGSTTTELKLFNGPPATLKRPWSFSQRASFWSRSSLHAGPGNAATHQQWLYKDMSALIFSTCSSSHYIYIYIALCIYIYILYIAIHCIYIYICCFVWNVGIMTFILFNDQRSIARTVSRSVLVFFLRQLPVAGTQFTPHPASWNAGHRTNETKKSKECNMYILLYNIYIWYKS